MGFYAGPAFVLHVYPGNNLMLELGVDEVDTTVNMHFHLSHTSPRSALTSDDDIARRREDTSPPTSKSLKYADILNSASNNILDTTEGKHLAVSGTCYVNTVRSAELIATTIHPHRTPAVYVRCPLPLTRTHSNNIQYKTRVMAGCETRSR